MKINNNADYCRECGFYGDDYFVDEDGDLTMRCPTCPFNPFSDTDYEEKENND